MLPLAQLAGAPAEEGGWLKAAKFTIGFVAEDGVCQAPAVKAFSYALYI